MAVVGSGNGPARSTDPSSQVVPPRTI
jgi:hypothetical protein